MDNYQIADQFALLAKLMDIHGENAFKSKSYAIAAYNIEQLPAQLTELPREKVPALKGIGDSTARKIFEILDTGKLQLLEDILLKTPEGVVQMLQVKGLGPKKIATVWKEMGIETVGELLYACQENRLMLYKGFGEKTQQNIRESIEFILRHQGQFLYAELEAAAFQLQTKLAADFPQERLSASGSYARQEPTLDKLEWVTTIPASLLSTWLENHAFEQVQQEASCIRAMSTTMGNCVFYLTQQNQFGHSLFVHSSADEFLQSWQDQQLSLPTEVEDEAKIFSHTGLDFIPPCLRNDGYFIPFAAKKNLPVLITDKDIRGIIHSHSLWSDGTHSLEEMAAACIKNNLEYLVISDHSKSAFYAKGLNEERILAQQDQIRELNKSLHPFKIFSSIECDILGDGSMDYADEVLAGFDLVIASVHSNLKMHADKAMQRLLGAVQNPYTTILGHPTGRLLLSRAGYPVDHSKLIDACVLNHVAIEINAHPRRLDLDWKWIPEALEKGAMLSIDPDAHSTEGYADTHYGVLVAQKGGLTKDRNLSSKSRVELEDYLAKRKKNRFS